MVDAIINVVGVLTLASVAARGVVKALKPVAAKTTARWDNDALLAVEEALDVADKLLGALGPAFLHRAKAKHGQR